MSSSSESEDENIKLMLEATDTTFLSDSMFKEKPKEESIAVKEESVLVREQQKSQRYLQDDDHNALDFVPPPTVQKMISKKLSILIEEQVEYVPPADGDECRKIKRKSRVRLLSDSELYAKPYEEFEYENLGPQIKPKIQRRAVEPDELDECEKIKHSVVDGETILSGKEIEHWSKKTKGKVFQYKAGHGTNRLHHLIEPENEFTKLRRKNKWDESKIKTIKFAK